MDDHTTHLQSLKGLVTSINELNVLAEQEYTPIVEAILRSRSRDTKQIENTLDGLFDLCGYEPPYCYSSGSVITTMTLIQPLP